MGVCVCARARACAHVHAYVCVRACVCSCLRPCMHTCVPIMCRCMYVWMEVGTSVILFRSTEVAVLQDASRYPDMDNLCSHRIVATVNPECNTGDFTVQVIDTIGSQSLTLEDRNDVGNTITAEIVDSSLTAGEKYVLNVSLIGDSSIDKSVEVELHFGSSGKVYACTYV